MATPKNQTMSKTRYLNYNCIVCSLNARVDIFQGNDHDTTEEKARPVWGRSIEFLMSCISMSVGLGNIWRFPFTAYENGGGAFLIPYVIVLILCGRPMYYLEMILGQFTSRSSVKIWAVCPLLKGMERDEHLKVEKNKMKMPFQVSELDR